MANIMLRKNDDGQLVFYLPKKDLEEAVVSIEHAGPDSWGGEIELADGSKYYLEPVVDRPHLPVSGRAKRLSTGD